MKVVLVSGANGALGEAVCRHLSSVGYAVLGLRGPGNDISFAAVNMTISGEVDLTDEEAIAATVDQFSMKGRQLDAIVNVAGGFVWETVADGAVATWQQMFDLNLKTALNNTKAYLPYLCSGGAIVNIGAQATRHCDVGMGAYAASKSALQCFTESLAAELRGAGIRANAILPSIIDTPQNREAMPEADFAEWVTPQSIARVIGFLISTESAAISGALIPVTEHAAAEND